MNLHVKESSREKDVGAGRRFQAGFIGLRAARQKDGAVFGPKKPDFSLKTWCNSWNGSNSVTFMASLSIGRRGPAKLDRNFIRRRVVADWTREPGFSGSNEDFISPAMTMAYFAQACLSGKDKAVYRNLLLASVGALALTGSAALAADLSSPPPPVPAFTWTGIYIGGQIGYIWGSGKLNYTIIDPFDNVFGTTGAGGSPGGVIGGGHAGYQYQINQWVIGIEGTVDGTNLNNTVASYFPTAFGGSIVTANTSADIQGSIRGRAGFAFDRALIYATGGVAFGGYTTTYTLAGNTNSLSGNNGGNTVSGSNSFSNSRVGWTVGGGIDYALTNNWSIFAEYRYTNFGTISSPGLAAAGFATAPGLTNAALNSNRTINQNQVQGGFSYKFDMPSPAPVVAKY